MCTFEWYVAEHHLVNQELITYSSFGDYYRGCQARSADASARGEVDVLYSTTLRNIILVNGQTAMIQTARTASCIGMRAFEIAPVRKYVSTARMSTLP